KWTGDDPTGGHPDTEEGRVQAAAAAAYWLDRWYCEFRRVEELERTVRSRDRRIETLEAQLADLKSAEKPTDSLRTHLRRTLPLVRNAIKNRTGR
ncbi:MAG: hypothetical protein R3246_16910, partial [Acidimicrobiia bacterium]|nr:hypothetical protein [Acidimicrobiia bacterium]